MDSERIEELNRERFMALESASIENAAQGLKALLLLNGGACIALLALIGSAATSERIKPIFVPVVLSATRSLAWFATGAGLAVLTFLVAYLANQAYAKAALDPKAASWKAGTRLNNGGTILAIAALFCFGKGVFDIACSLP